MSFDIFNNVAGFQNNVSKILTEKFDILKIVYLDDILIYIKNQGKSDVEGIC